MNHSMGLLVGGVLPAFAFGIGALLQKQSNDIGIGQSPYLVYFAAGIFIASLVAYFAFPENSHSLKAGAYATGHGLLFGAGFVCLAMVLTVYAEPISKRVPLANMSTLVSVVLGLIVFSEYTRMNLGYLLGGAALIVVGGILVARA
ncbi:hypothetical protein BST95_13380 [Halioglobus japonicus]|uniref:EamA domain-containing protein n=1 Tax=Halioglobus japonicus TaxID=930805 RepID=A0AAP8MHF5_9GAMM|nr:hypothetical protein [Halioglobus japonicus]AQA19086.1 hypothetical protein BST95_13380 [Halioglobus japonicus]PLW87891.1 hypothetical protein C0029_04805 [Halioglobus japonicus]